MSSSKQSFFTCVRLQAFCTLPRKNNSQSTFFVLSAKKKKKTQKKKEKRTKITTRLAQPVCRIFLYKPKKFFLQFSQRGNQNCKEKSFLYFPYFLTFKKSRRSAKYIHLSFRTYGIFLYPNVLFYFQFSQKTK